MTVLSILYNQKNTIIGQREPGTFWSDLLAAPLNTWSAVSKRGILVDATINEEHQSSYDITDNPVEDGASITDHAQAKPMILTIDGVISDAPLGLPIVGNIQNMTRTISTAFGNSSRSIDN